MTLFETTMLSKAGMSETDEFAKAALARANIFGMTQDAEDAVLRPKDSGAFGHDLRAALAARIAHQAEDETLADHYFMDAGQYAVLANPNQSGEAQGLNTLLSFVDKVANQTRDTATEDVSSLQNAGVSDADIVRLCELVAFMAFQVRVIAGLRLMQNIAA